MNLRRLFLMLTLLPMLCGAAVPASITRAVKQADSAASLKAECTLNGHAASLTLSGDCFIIDMAPVKIYFDGKTQYTWSPADKELIIMEPTAEELSQSNPLQILRTLGRDFNGAAVKGKANTVRLTPADPRNEIAEATVTLDPASGWPTEMTVISAGGRADIKNLRFTPSATKQPAEAFRFKAPAGARVTDLR